MFDEHTEEMLGLPGPTTSLIYDEMTATIQETLAALHAIGSSLLTSTHFWAD